MKWDDQILQKNLKEDWKDRLQSNPSGDKNITYLRRHSKSLISLTLNGNKYSAVDKIICTYLISFLHVKKGNS